MIKKQNEHKNQVVEKEDEQQSSERNKIINKVVRFSNAVINNSSSLKK